MLSLKSTLLLNGISAGATGIGLLVFSEKVAAFFGVQSTGPFIATGIFFIGFATLVLYTALQKEKTTALLRTISFLDISWVAVSLIIAATSWGAVTVPGYAAILVVAVWVAMMAYLQYKSVSRQRVC